MDYNKMASPERISSHATMQTRHCKAAANISRDKKVNIKKCTAKLTAALVDKAPALKDYPTTHHLRTQNQLIGNEDTGGR